MITIKEGSLEKPKPKWIGAQIRCSKCKAIYELEEEDASLIITNGYDQHVNCQTPGCNMPIRIPVMRELHIGPSPRLAGRCIVRSNDE